MKHYLVVQRCNLDDLPVYLTADRLKAVAVATSLEPEDPRSKAVQEELTVDASGPISVMVYTFGSDGKFIEAELIRDYNKKLNEELNDDSQGG